MGQGGSKDSLVFVQLEKPCVYAGGTVRGCVHLHSVDDLSVNSIYIKVSGQEACHWETGSGENKTYYRGRHTLLKGKHDLMGPCQLHAGSYSFPFSFQLPADLPGSFELHHCSTRASVRYVIKAKCDHQGPDCRHQVALGVLQRATAPARPIRERHVAPVSLLCCISRGAVHLDAACECTSFLPGQELPVRVTVANHTARPLKCVRAQLVQVLHLRTSTGPRPFRHTFRYVKVSQEVPLGARGAKGALSGAPGDSVELHMALPLEATLEATCFGQIVTSSYELRVQAPSGCCMTTAQLRAAVLIHDPEPAPDATPPLPQPPPGWAPVQYPATNFAVALGVPEQQGCVVEGVPVDGGQAPQPMQHLPLSPNQRQVVGEGDAPPVKGQPG